MSPVSAASPFLAGRQMPPGSPTMAGSKRHATASSASATIAVWSRPPERAWLRSTSCIPSTSAPIEVHAAVNRLPSTTPSASERPWRMLKLASRTPPQFSRSASVTHAGVLHAKDLNGLVLLERGVDDLTEEQRVVADVDRLSHGAVDVGDRLVENRRAGAGGVEGKPVQRARGQVHLDRLGELADDGAVLATHDVDRERPALGDEAVGDRFLLDRDADALGIEAHLGDPVRGHQVQPVAVPRADHVEAARHRPEHAPPELVVRLGVCAFRDGADDSLLHGHGSTLDGRVVPAARAPPATAANEVCGGPLRGPRSPGTARAAPLRRTGDGDGTTARRPRPRPRHRPPRSPAPSSRRNGSSPGHPRPASRDLTPSLPRARDTAISAHAPRRCRETSTADFEPRAARPFRLVSRPFRLVSRPFRPASEPRSSSPGRGPWS